MIWMCWLANPRGNAYQIDLSGGGRPANQKWFASHRRQAASRWVDHHLRRLDEQAPKEIPTTERVSGFIMATTLQSDHKGRETLPENRRAGRSLLRVPYSGKRRPDYNLIRVERRNGVGASPPLVSGKCRRSSATSEYRCVQRSAHEKDLARQAYLHKPGKSRTRKGHPGNGQSGCETGGIKGATRRTGLKDCKMGNVTVARLKALGRTALNRSYGSVADSPGDLPRRSYKGMAEK